MFKKILLEIGLNEETTTTSGNKKLAHILAPQLPLPAKVDLAGLTPHHWQSRVSNFRDTRSQ